MSPATEVEHTSTLFSFFYSVKPTVWGRGGGVAVEDADSRERPPRTTRGTTPPEAHQTTDGAYEGTSQTCPAATLWIPQRPHGAPKRARARTLPSESPEASTPTPAPRPAAALRAQPRDHELDHRVEERLRPMRRAASRAARRSPRSGSDRSRASRAGWRPPTRRTGRRLRARRRCGSLGEDLQAALPEPRHLLEHALGQLADHGLVLERPEDLEVLAVLRPVREVEARDPADPIGRGSVAPRPASRSLRSNCSPLLASTAT